MAFHSLHRTPPLTGHKQRVHPKWSHSTHMDVIYENSTNSLCWCNTSHNHLREPEAAQTQTALRIFINNCFLTAFWQHFRCTAVSPPPLELDPGSWELEHVCNNMTASGTSCKTLLWAVCRHLLTGFVMRQVWMPLSWPLQTSRNRTAQKCE